MYTLSYTRQQVSTQVKEVAPRRGNLQRASEVTTMKECHNDTRQLYQVQPAAATLLTSRRKGTTEPSPAVATCNIKYCKASAMCE